MRQREQRQHRPVARQVFTLQLVTVVLVVVGAAVLAYLDARDSRLDDARLRAVAIARAVADAPSVTDALATPNPSIAIQPYAERVREDTGTDFVVVMGLDRTRYSHPDPEQLGEKFIGDLGGAPDGVAFAQEYTGTLGPSLRSVVPVFGEDGEEVVALVSVGITLDRLEDAVRARLLPIGLAGAGLLALGAFGAWVISRRVRRQTHGLGERELTRMYEFYDATLHAVREGLVLVDELGIVSLANDEAERLLGIGPLEGRAVDTLPLPPDLVAALLGGLPGVDQIHLLETSVVVVNRETARWQGKEVGAVVTLRDHTELRQISGELDSVRGLAEALRSQNHEAANRLHTVVSLVELGRHDDAVAFATDELASAQDLADRVMSAVTDPVVGALVLGKTAQARERGVDLVVSPDTSWVDSFLRPGDAVTLIGNLLDNAIEAVGDQQPVKGDDRPRTVEVCIVGDAAQVVVQVDDSGPGLPPDAARVFERDWSTKRGDAALGRGLGLALVGQVVRRYRGTITTDRSHLGGASFTVRVPAP